MFSFFLWYPAEYLLLSKTLVLRLEGPSIISFSIYNYEEDFMHSPENREHRAPTLHHWSTRTLLVLEIDCIPSRFWPKEITGISKQPWLLLRWLIVLNKLLVIPYCWRQNLHNSLNNQLYIHWLSNILQFMLLNIFHNPFQFYNLFLSIFLFYFNSLSLGIFSIIWLNFCDF